ncbi:tetratricopeptide repeat protein [Desulfovibrio mangrovi]|uniref:tetratricopeptide repeat protein n=1 Tax=Desulfovibrio mangrovi TaxID=2976983 RepID=UPI002248367E|nr:tetratricopeptide repeat protein [Desulfovibrio mangrovi]UZP67540.1 tetratricopeptide repeat protein [Desulfovibrio mangrovi]
MAFFRTILCALIILPLFVSGCAGDSSKDFFKEGEQLLKDGNSGGAIVLFKSALDLDPGYYDARLKLGIAYMYSGKPEQAEKELQKAFHQKQDDPALLIAMARLYTAWNKGEEALVPLKRLENLSKVNAESEELLGLAKAILRDKPEAIAAFKRSLEIDPKRQSARLALARYYFFQQMYDDSRSELSLLTEEAPDDVGVLKLAVDLEMKVGTAETQMVALRNMLKVKPQDVYGRYWVGVLLLREGDLNGSQAMLASMKQDAPEDYYTRMLEGVLAFREGDYLTALNQFQKCVAIRPTYDAYFKLGVAANAKGDVETALSHFQVIVDYWPNDEAARRMIATILMRQGRLEEAEQVTEKLVEINPENVWANFMLGNTLMARGELDKAEQAFDAAIAKEPGMVLAHLRKGAIYKAKGETKAVQSSLESAVDGAPDNLLARTALANFHIQRRNLKEARKVLEGGLGAGGSSDAQVYNQLASLDIAERNKVEAIKHLDRAIKADSKFEPTYFDKVNLYLADGKQEKALAELDTLLAVNPESVRGLIASAALLDVLGRDDAAEARLLKARSISHQPMALELIAVRYLRMGRTDEALATLSSAEGGPGSEPLVNLRANILMNSNKPDEALKVYESVASTMPILSRAGTYRIYSQTKQYDKALVVAREIETFARTPAEAQLGIIFASRSLEQQGKSKEAFEGLEQAYKATPSPELLLEQAAMSTRQKNFEKAETYLSACIKRYDDYAPAKSALGNLYILKGQREEAIKVYEGLVQGGAADLTVLNNLAMLYIDSNSNKEQALRIAYAAYMKAPANPAVLDTLGVVLLGNNRAADAVRVFQRAIAIVPDQPSLRYQLGRALAAAGKVAEAKKELKSALEMGTFPESDKARKLMGELNKS